MFPDAEIVASDLTPEKGEWCAAQWGAHPHVGDIDLDRLALPGEFDLIWLGSVVTHLQEGYAKRLLAKLRDHTAPHGLLIASTLGRLFIPRLALAVEQGTTQEIWAFDQGHALEILASTARTGYCFASHKSLTEFDRRYVDRPTDTYGTSLTKLEWWARFVEELADVRLHFFEAAWDQLHDVVVLQRTHISQGWRRDILGE
jgi:hypothetical protein